MKGNTKLGLDDYKNIGRPPGDFLYAVLTNDLKESFARADEDNRRDMFDIVAYVYNNMPAVAWGTKDKVEAWVMHRGIAGLQDEAC